MDTLFTLDEAETNYRVLRRNDVPVKMLWFCGGHGGCLTDPGRPGTVEEAALDWFDRYLNRDQSTGTGARFRWVADDGKWRSSDRYPLDEREPLKGTGDGDLPLVAGASTSGTLIASQPQPNGVDVEIEPPDGGADLIGQPKVRITYSGTAEPKKTVVYAQVVDRDRNLVLGNLVTPIPLKLDGEERTVERPLEAIAARSGEDSSYAVQIVAGSNIYDLQRSSGLADFEQIRAKLPVGDRR